MRPSTQFTVEVAAGDDIATEVLTRQLRVDLRALGSLSLEPMFAPMPVSVDDEPFTKSSNSQPLGVIAVSGVQSAETVKGLFDLLTAFVNRTAAGSATVRRGQNAVTVTGVSPKDASNTLFDLEDLLSDGDK